MLTSREKLQKLTILLITWGVLFACFVTYERFFVNGQDVFLKQRGFHALNTLADELRAKVEQAQKSTESSLRLVASPQFQKDAKAFRSTEDRMQELWPYLTLYLKGVWTGDEVWSEDTDKASRKHLLEAILQCNGFDRKQIPLEFIPEGLNLSVYCFKHESEIQDTADLKGNIQIYRLDLTPWVGSGFEDVGGYFDDVLVTDVTGHVVFQKSPTGPRILDLKSLVSNNEEVGAKPKGTESFDSSDRGADRHLALIEADLKALRAESAQQHRSLKDGGREQARSHLDQETNTQGASGFDKLTKASTLQKVTVAGESYELFAQPVRIDLESIDHGKPWTLLVCGLRYGKGLEKESHALPYSTLIWAALIGVALVSLSWPMFKLRYMSNTERISPKDGWYLIITIFLASTSAMLMLLNASYTSQVQRLADSDMERLAYQIKDNFHKEMSSAFWQLTQFRHDTLFMKGPKDSAAPTLIPNYLDQANPKPRCYPYFEIAFWANRNGQQLLKFDVRPATTPPTNVRSFLFFKDVVADLRWPNESRLEVPEKQSSCPTPKEAELDKFEYSYVQPSLSPNTDEFSAILSAPFVPDRETVEQTKIPVVQVLSIRPMSLVDPILPPGYGFAMIDAECKVLFHSDSSRNMRENFCQESKSNAELRPWLFGGVDTPVDITYAGRPERAYLTSIQSPRFATGPTFLVVFREPDVQLTLNLAVVLVCSMLLGFYFLILLLAAVLYHLWRVRLPVVYPPRFIWPCPENALSYVQLFGANTLMLLMFRLSYPYLYEAPLLGLTLAVALLPVLLAILRLTCPDRVLLGFGTVLASVSLLVLLVLLLPKTEPATEWRIVFGLLGVFGLIAVLLSERLSWVTRLMARIRQPAQKHFSLAYLLAVLTVITAAGLVPCAGFFKYAYDAVSELSLKRDQIVLSERLLARTNRIERYYELLRAPMEIAQSRMNQSWDRYDRSFFTITGDPAFGPDRQHPRPTNQDTPDDFGYAADGSGERSWIENHINQINDTTEKYIARATLQLPTNELGSEMSKLGVASTTDRTRAWEHYWDEASPTRFKLSWKNGSRLSMLTVTSLYSDWRGMQWFGYSGVALLWAVLIFWLLSLVKTIFFTDVETPPAFDEVSWTSVADIQSHFLVIGRTKSGKTGWLRSLSGLPSGSRLDLRVELTRMISDWSYKKPDCLGPVVILDHFEFNMKESDYNLVRLKLLESLLYDSPCTLVVVSTVDPLYFLTEGTPEMLSKDKDPASAARLLDRWARVIGKFARVRPKDSLKREFDQTLAAFAKNHPDNRQFAIWVRQECNCTVPLQNTGKEILDRFQEGDRATRESVVKSVLDRSDPYYHVLWSGMTASERLVLYQLALDGWANPKNTAAIQQLERKLIIRRDPMYRIMNESFRYFIESAEHADEIAQWEKRERQSTWRVLRFVIFAVVIGAGGWLFYTQAALSQVIVGYIAAIATLVTTAAGLFGRSGRSAPAKLESS